LKTNSPETTFDQLKIVNELFSAPDYHEPVAGEQPKLPRSLSMVDFRGILAQRKPSVSMEMIRAYYKWSEQFKAL